MRTTIDLDQQSYRLAKAIAAQKGISMGKFVAEAVRAYTGTSEASRTEITYNEAGFPTISTGAPVTSEDVAELLDD